MLNPTKYSIPPLVLGRLHELWDAHGEAIREFNELCADQRITDVYRMSNGEFEYTLPKMEGE